MITLTQEQQQAVKNGEAVRMPSPDLGEDVVLLRAVMYEKIRELLEDDREQQAVLRYSMRQAVRIDSDGEPD